MANHPRRDRPPTAPPAGPEAEAGPETRPIPDADADGPAGHPRPYNPARDPAPLEAGGADAPAAGHIGDRGDPGQVPAPGKEVSADARRAGTVAVVGWVDHDLEVGDGKTAPVHTPGVVIFNQPEKKPDA